MLFNVNRQTSFALLQLATAGFILLVPSLLGFLSINAEVYFMASVVTMLLAIRVKSQEKVSISLLHFVFAFLAAYGVLSSLWVNNREGQLSFITALITGAGFYSLTFTYFSENADSGIGRRMMNMLSMSALLCAVINVIYWLLYIVPVAGNEALGTFLGTPDFTAVFMGVGVVVSCSLMKGSSKAKRFLLLASAAVMAFVFVMGKSPVAWMFTIVTVILIYIKKNKKYEKNFVLISLVISAVFSVVVFLMLSRSENSVVFKDVFSYGWSNIFGHGGGFGSGKQIFLSQDYPGAVSVGLMAYLFAASGLAGFISCILIVARNVILVIKTKTAESVIALLLTVILMLIPFGNSFAVILLWLGFMGYVEQSAGFGMKLQIKKEKLEKTLLALYVIVIIAVMLLLLSIVKMSADRAYSKKNYDEAYSLYKTVATINLSDGESCRKAAAALRKSGRLENNEDEAVRIINAAIRRDSDNLENLKEKAMIYEKCGEFELGAQQYRDASQRAFIKGSYNLDLAKILYKIVKQAPKGSSETKRAYEEIVSIAAITEDLDLRKEINDIADKAMQYTKGELSDER